MWNDTVRVCARALACHLKLTFVPKVSLVVRKCENTLKGKDEKNQLKLWARWRDIDWEEQWKTQKDKLKFIRSLFNHTDRQTGPGTPCVGLSDGQRDRAQCWAFILNNLPFSLEWIGLSIIYLLRDFRSSVIVLHSLKNANFQLWNVWVCLCKCATRTMSSVLDTHNQSRLTEAVVCCAPCSSSQSVHRICIISPPRRACCAL